VTKHITPAQVMMNKNNARGFISAGILVRQGALWLLMQLLFVIPVLPE